MLKSMRESYLFDLIFRRAWGLRRQPRAMPVPSPARVHDLLHTWAQELASYPDPLERQGLLIGLLRRLLAVPKAADLREYPSFANKLQQAVAAHTKGEFVPDVVDQLSKDCVTLSWILINAR